MTRDPLDRPATPARLHALAEAGALTPAALARALELASASPGAAAWKRFLERVLLALGAALAVAGVAFFVAYNWNDLGKAAKFALLEGALLAAALLAWRLGVERLSGRIALAGAAALVGPLLALYGQTYQTGADPHELFVAWLALIAPWVVVGRFPPLWLLAVALADTALVLYWAQVIAPNDWFQARGAGLYLALFAVHGAAWLGWELLARRGVAWVSGRWMPRLLAAAAFASLVWPSVVLIVENRYRGVPSVAALVILVALIVLVGWLFQFVTQELFMLAAAAGSAMIVVSTAIARVIFEENNFAEGNFLFFGLVLIAQVALAAWWLRTVSKGWETE